MSATKAHTPGATKAYPPPPHWPCIFINAAEWQFFEEAGFDMREFFLVRPIPTNKDDQK